MAKNMPKFLRIRFQSQRHKPFARLRSSLRSTQTGKPTCSVVARNPPHEHPAGDIQVTSTMLIKHLRFVSLCPCLLPRLLFPTFIANYFTVEV